MGIFKKHFPLGLGTARFPISGPQDTQGFETSVQIVLRALELGMDYVDVGHMYSAGMALHILREAFHRTDRPFSVTAKVQYGIDYTAEDAVGRVEYYLKTMDLPKAQYFTCWCIWSYADFEKIMAPGGIYDGAKQLQQQGKIDHICASLHAPPQDIIRIIESGAFEGITISYSLLNAAQMRPVLEAAQQHDVSVAVMNPLGGGVIAQNTNYFSFACGDGDENNTIHAALRFVKSHPAVDIVLSGANSPAELEDSFGVFSSPDPQAPADRYQRVLEQASSLQGFCTGCKYCEGCPKGIPTHAIMQARNALLFEPVASYNRQGPEDLLRDLQIFRKLYYDDGWFPETAENPCIGCGKCERSCTQKLAIIEGVADIYARAKARGYHKQAQCDRLKELLYQKGYQRVGLYPNGGFTRRILDFYQECFGEPDFEWIFFNSSPALWGTSDHGHIVHGPSEIPELRPDIILISTYRYDEEIMDSLRPFAELGIQIEKLHRESDMPWIF